MPAGAPFGFCLPRALRRERNLAAQLNAEVDRSPDKPPKKRRVFIAVRVGGCSKQKSVRGVPGPSPTAQNHRDKDAVFPQAATNYPQGQKKSGRLEIRRHRGLNILGRVRIVVAIGRSAKNAKWMEYFRILPSSREDFSNNHRRKRRRAANGAADPGKLGKLVPIRGGGGSNGQFKRKRNPQSSREHRRNPAPTPVRKSCESDGLCGGRDRGVQQQGPRKEDQNARKNFTCTQWVFGGK